jgi:outer membrane protein assembly factor BamB
VQWTLDVAGGRGAAVAVAGDGTVFIAGGSSVVAAHGTSGATVWNVTLSGTVFPNTLVVTGSGQVRVVGGGVSPLLHACFSQQTAAVSQHRLSSPCNTFDAHAYALA